MKKLNITFREVKHGQFKGEIDCVFLDHDMHGINLTLACYSRIGQHSSGCVSYFYNSTKPAKEYQSLLKEIRSIYSEFEIVVHNKLPSYDKILRGLKNV